MNGVFPLWALLFLCLALLSSLYPAAYDKIDWWLWPLWPFPPPPRGPPTLRPPTSCWPLKWDPDVAIVMREAPASSGMLSGRWKNHKWAVEECFEDIMERFETSSWEHLCGRPSPSVARVVSGCTLSLPLPLYLYGIFSMKKTIMNDQY